MPFIKCYIKCDLHKTAVTELLCYSFQINSMQHLLILFRVVISIGPVFISVTVNTILKTFTIFLFKILCCHCWKTAAVHQRMIMLELVVGRENSTTTSFTYNTFSSHLGGVASGMLHRKKYKGASCSEAMSWWATLNLSSLSENDNVRWVRWE